MQGKILDQVATWYAFQYSNEIIEATCILQVI